MPFPGLAQGSGTVRKTLPQNTEQLSNCFANKIHTEMFIKYITFFIGQLVRRNERLFSMVYIY